MLDNIDISTEVKEMATVYVYALCDPDTKLPKYIGQSVNPHKRYIAHLAEAKSPAFYGGHKKASWINDLRTQNKLPDLQILQEVDHKSCDGAEQYWIDKFRSEGLQLLNGLKPNPNKLSIRAAHGSVNPKYL